MALPAFADPLCCFLLVRKVLQDEMLWEMLCKLSSEDVEFLCDVKREILLSCQ